jgi:CRP-like cAMP-binding protein
MDTILAREGDIAKELVLLESGRVVMAINGVTFGHLEEGDFLGETMLVPSRRHPATIYTETSVDAHVISQQELSSMFDILPSLKEILIDAAERKLERIVEFQKAPAEDRSA